MKLSPKALGLTFGSLWGLTLFFCTLVAANTSYMFEMLSDLVGVYPWYTVTTEGAFIGLGLAFIDGLLGGAILAWVYNKFLDVCVSEKKVETPRRVPPATRKRSLKSKK